MFFVEFFEIFVLLSQFMYFFFITFDFVLVAFDDDLEFFLFFQELVNLHVDHLVHEVLLLPFVFNELVDVDDFGFFALPWLDVVQSLAH